MKRTAVEDALAGWRTHKKSKATASPRNFVDMARHEGREAATPVVMGEQLDPPKYGELWSEAASRVFFASYREHEQHVKFANAEGVVRRQLMSVSQLIPVYVQRSFAQHYYQRKVLNAEELLNALKQHAGYSTAGGQMVRERAATEIRRVAKIQPAGGTVKDRVIHVSSTLENNFFDYPEIDDTGLATGSTFLARLSQCPSLWWMVFRVRNFATACVRN